MLDPACGDGQLLAAVAAQGAATHVDVVGFDSDEVAVEAARERLAAQSGGLRRSDIRAADFLNALSDRPAATSGADTLTAGGFDLVITNPPWVRTQHLSAGVSQQLARRFGLDGRVDTYAVFAMAASRLVTEGGVLAVLAPNRFLTTAAGRRLRERLLAEHHLQALYDLGDTKVLSDAGKGPSVLPAILIARRSAPGHDPTRTCDYVSIYRSETPPSKDLPSGVSVPHCLDAVAEGASGEVATTEGWMTIRRGALRVPSSHAHRWRMTTPAIERTLDRIAQHTEGRFCDVGNVHVGVKTGADAVYIRNDWDQRPLELTPEDALLKPLLSTDEVQRWCVQYQPPRHRILYPYDTTSHEPVILDLAPYPRARAYLQSHAALLANRAGLGRRPYEALCQPQQLSAWAKPRLVWPDIAPRLRCALDTSAAVVGGARFWMLAPDDESLLRRMLGVANSRIASITYDLNGGERLYHHRRRFVTAFMNTLPIPAPNEHTTRLEDAVAELLRPGLTAGDRAQLDAAVDTHALAASGLTADAIEAPPAAA